MEITHTNEIKRKLDENDYPRKCYTYLIGWTKYNKWYYGKKTARYCKVENFWKDYFTSSKRVKEFIEEYGQPDIIEIRNTFGKNFKECSNWESRVLHRIDAKRNDNFLNKTNGDKEFDTTGYVNSRKGIPQTWFVGYDIDGNCVGKIPKNDPQRGISIFGANYGIQRPQDYILAFDKNHNYIGRIPKDDPLWGIDYFGVMKNTSSKYKGIPQDWAVAFDKDGNKIGKVLSTDPGWGVIYFGQNTGGTRSDKGITRETVAAYNINGIYLGLRYKEDLLWGIEYFGNRKGKPHSSKGKTLDWFNAYDENGKFIGKRPKDDPERGITVFGANTGRQRPEKGIKQTWACAYDRDGKYVGKIDRNDPGWKDGTYRGNVKKKK